MFGLAKLFDDLTLILIALGMITVPKMICAFFADRIAAGSSRGRHNHYGSSEAIQRCSRAAAIAN
jgi:hypothetical protein